MPYPCNVYVYMYISCVCVSLSMCTEYPVCFGKHCSSSKRLYWQVQHKYWPKCEQQNMNSLPDILYLAILEWTMYHLFALFNLVSSAWPYIATGFNEY